MPARDVIMHKNVCGWAVAAAAAAAASAALAAANWTTPGLWRLAAEPASAHL